MHQGIRLGVDPGRTRVGLARSDPSGLLAMPVETLPRGSETVSRILSYAAQYQAIEIVVGLPLSLRGSETASTGDARALAAEIASATDIPVRLVDERLSTVSAWRQLKESGRRGAGKKAVVDQAAAVIILQNALDAERAANEIPPQLERVTRGH